MPRSSPAAALRHDRASAGGETREPGAGPWLRSRTLAQGYCLLIGAFLLIRGASTLVAGASFAFPGDGWRGCFQLLVAGLLLVGSAGAVRAYRTVLGVGVLYALITALGIASGHDIVGILPLDMRDKIVHPALALLALIVVLCGPTRLVWPRRSTPPVV